MKSILKAVLWTLFAVLVAAQTHLAHAQDPEVPLSLEQKLEDLAQKVKILASNRELDQEAAQTKENAAVSANGKEGFSLKSWDGAYSLKIGAVIQVDNWGYPGNPSPTSLEGFLLRKVRPSFEGRVQNRAEFKIVPEFGEGKAGVQDVYADLILGPWLKVRLGKAKVPFSLERLQADPVLAFIERGLPTGIAPNRDLGIQILGDFAGGRVQAVVGVFNGVPDGGSADLEADSAKDAVVRFFAQPLKALGLGAAFTYGEPKGISTATGLATGYKTEGQRTFFGYRPTVINRDRRFRSTAHAYSSRGPLGLQLEYIRSAQDVQTTPLSARNVLNHETWQAILSYAVTGEDASYKGVRTRKQFDPAAVGWGALELVLRASSLTLDQDSFPLFADPAKSASRAQAWTAGANWILGPNLKVYLDYGRTRFRGGYPDSAKYRPTEKLLFSRFQVAF